MDGGILALGNNSGLSSGIHPPLFLPTEGRNGGPFCVGETEGYSMMKVGDRTPIKVLKSDAEMHSALKQGWKCFFLIEKPEASTGQQNNKKRNRRNRRGQRKKVNPSGEPGAAGSTGDAVSTEQAVQPLGADFPKLRGPRVKRQVDDEVTTERSSQTSEAERPTAVPGPGGYMTRTADRLKTKFGEYCDIVVTCTGAVATVCLTLGYYLRGHTGT
eukprot:GHVQ01001221.1.p1 GENE.GHVQ01001221.1~~GHVQ01001221.1.p1  ORF type:complete len:215 (+),score=21.39 GHVQ01001221.1:607-1251(+)